MRIVRLCTLLLLLLLLASPVRTLRADSTRYAPQKLSDENTRVTFELDSTWHSFGGVAKNIKGMLWRTTSGDPRTIQAQVSFPVVSFDTDNSLRDNKMRSVMAAERFPEVHLSIISIDPSCFPSPSVIPEGCQGTMKATLGIRDVIREISLPYSLAKTSSGFEIRGEIRFEWAAFGVEDPSILIAKVDPEVLIRYSCRIAP